MGVPASARGGSCTRPLVFLLVFFSGLFLVRTASFEEQARSLHVNTADPDCRGKAPCYATIQGAVDTAQLGDTVRIPPRTYQVQVSPVGKNDFTGADEPDRIVIEADPGAAASSVTCPSTSTVRMPDDSAIAMVVILGSGAVTHRSEMA